MKIVRPPIAVAPVNLPSGQEYDRLWNGEYIWHSGAQTGWHINTAMPDRSGAEFARLVCHIAGQGPFCSHDPFGHRQPQPYGRKSLVDYFGEQKGGSIWIGSPSTTDRHGSCSTKPRSGSVYSRATCLSSQRIPELSLLQNEKGLEPPTGSSRGASSKDV